MPTITNKTPHGFGLRIGRSIGPNETLEVTEAEAQVLQGHPRLTITPDAAPAKARRHTHAHHAPASEPAQAAAEPTETPSTPVEDSTTSSTDKE